MYQYIARRELWNGTGCLLVFPGKPVSDDNIDSKYGPIGSSNSTSHVSGIARSKGRRDGLSNDIEPKKSIRQLQRSKVEVKEGVMKGKKKRNQLFFKEIWH